jgi:ribonuclease P protein component
MGNSAMYPLSKKDLIWKKPRKQLYSFCGESNFGLMFRWISSHLESNGFGAIVPKRVGKTSVLRHKIKRRLRHAFMLSEPRLRTPVSVVCIVNSPQLEHKKFLELLDTFQHFVRHVNDFTSAHFAFSDKDIHGKL